jgi:hypothetical protein
MQIKWWFFFYHSTTIENMDIYHIKDLVLALRCRGTNHGKRMKGIAQGLLQASQTYNCFTKQEQTAISNILDRV